MTFSATSIKLLIMSAIIMTMIWLYNLIIDKELYVVYLSLSLLLAYVAIVPFRNQAIEEESIKITYTSTLSILLLTSIISILLELVEINILHVQVLRLLLRYINSFLLSGLALILSLNVSRTDLILMLSHPVSVAIAAIVGLASLYTRTNLYIIIPSFIITISLLLLVNHAFLCKRNLAHDIEIHKDMILIFLTTLVFPITYIIFNPCVPFESEDIQRNIYYAMLATKLPKLSLSYDIIFVPLIYGLDVVAPYAVYLAILITPLQALTLYLILRYFLPPRLAILTYVLYFTGLCSMPILNALSKSDYYIPIPASPILPLSLISYLIKYKYIMTSILSIYIILIFLIDNELQLSLSTKVLLTMLLGIVTVQHLLSLVLLIVTICIYILLVSFRKITFNRDEVPILRNVSFAFFMLLWAFLLYFIGNIGKPHEILSQLVFIEPRLYIMHHVIFDNPTNALLLILSFVCLIFLSIIIYTVPKKISLYTLTLIRKFLAFLSIVSVLYVVTGHNQKTHIEAIHTFPWSIGPAPSVFLASYSIVIFILTTLRSQWQGTSISTKLKDFLFVLVTSGIFGIIIMYLLVMTEMLYRVSYSTIALFIAIFLALILDKKLQHLRLRTDRRFIEALVLLFTILFFMLHPMLIFSANLNLRHYCHCVSPLSLYISRAC